MVVSSLLLLIENNLEDLGAILLGAQTLTDNLDWVDEIAEDSVVNGSERTGTWALLGLGSAGTVGTLWAGKDTAGSEDDNGSVRELLLELTDETVQVIRTGMPTINGSVKR